MDRAPRARCACRLGEPQMLAAMSVVEQKTEVEILPDAWPQMRPDPGLLTFSY